ncbi:MAG TPA: efflux RND transporter periplasmic adaptor subunit [Terriglobia bacterium]|nr:efflux RND transporter periplasmic adaptor subunit [Terriglobia bacterium]
MNAKLSQTAALITLCVAASFQFGCSATKTNRGIAQTQSTPNGTGESSVAYQAGSGVRGVATMTVKAEPIPDYLNVPAQIEADPTLVVHVFTPAGGRITEMKVRPWDHVVKGKTLAMLYSNDLARVVADYHKSLVDNRVKQEALARAQNLFAHRAIAQKDLEQAQGDAAMAEAEVKATRAQIQVFGINPDNAGDQLRIVAARSGVILNVGASQGEFSNGLSTPQPLCTIADLDTVWAVGELLESDLYRVHVGDPVELSLVSYPGKAWRGRVSVISSSVDPVTRTLQVRVVLRNPDGKLHPGMYGTLRLVRAKRMAIAVPNAAVLREGNSAFVFVEQSPGHFIRRVVSLGDQAGGMEIEVTSGLNPGDRIVVAGADLLRSAVGSP